MLEVMQPASWKSGSSVRSGVVGLEKLLVEGGENDLFEGELGFGRRDSEESVGGRLGVGL